MSGKKKAKNYSSSDELFEELDAEYEKDLRGKISFKSDYDYKAMRN